MNTVGKILLRERRKRRFSLAKLSERTKIKEQYLRAIEKEEWGSLPNFATTQGFVKNVASALGTNPGTAVALLRRDWEERKVEKETGRGHIATLWTPKTTTMAIGILVTLLVGFYLIEQYKTFTAPPPLDISETTRVANGVKISGQTASEAQVLINGEPLLVDKNGNFSITITQLQPGGKLTVESRSRSGKSTKKEIIVP